MAIKVTAKTKRLTTTLSLLHLPAGPANTNLIQQKEDHTRKDHPHPVENKKSRGKPLLLVQAN
jgi:hypothetical protein